MLAEEIAIEYLTDCGFTVFAEVPANRPDEFVTVERTGNGVTERPLEAPTLAIQTWARSLHRAAKMADEVYKALDSLPEHYGQVVECELNSRYPYRDQERRAERYQSVYDLLCYL